MPRPRSEKVTELKLKLLTRIREGFFRPGDRFLSNRALSMRFDVSYQTAHRLIDELRREGWIERRHGSGTYIAGKKANISGVQLLFHKRAKRPDSFGERLFELLRARLEREKIEWAATFVQTHATLRSDFFPVIWECREAVLPRLVPGCYALLLHDVAPPGLAGIFIDTISTDDFSGGACAAEVLRSRGHRGAAVLAGPQEDSRSVRRVEGFQSVLPDAKVVWSSGWFMEDGMQAAARVLKTRATAVFCCNDRLAEGLLNFCKTCRRDAPDVVGFDDAPIAEALDLTTIAVPWDEMIEAALTVIRKRLRGETATATRQILAPRPVIRR
jgi:DNA-binding transcriptional regulator YhcF (GntR family)